MRYKRIAHGVELTRIPVARPRPRLLPSLRHLRPCHIDWWEPAQCPIPIAHVRSIPPIRKGGTHQMNTSLAYDCAGRASERFCPAVLPGPRTLRWLQFKSRTELFIGPGHHDLMGALYDILSHVEHLHENRYLEPFDRDVRLDLVKKEAIVESIARKSLSRIINKEALRPHFGNTAALERFWAFSPDERRRIWGDPIDPMVPIADFDPKYLQDGRLDKT